MKRKQNFTRHVTIATNLADLLDTKFAIFRFRFGIDPLLDLIPYGSTASALFSLYIIWVGYQHALPNKTLLTMGKNILIDYLVSLIPVIGWIADFGIKANTKNVALLKQHLEDVEEGEII